MTTIGYGDMIVRVQLSRLIIFFCSFYGAIMFPLLVVAITNIFELKNSEKTTFLIGHLIEDKSKLKQRAVKVIITYYRLYKARQNHETKLILQYENSFTVVLKKFIKFKHNYRNYRNMGEEKQMTL